MDPSYMAYVVDAGESNLMILGSEAGMRYCLWNEVIVFLVMIKQILPTYLLLSIEKRYLET